MAFSREILNISKEVVTVTEECATYIPPNGSYAVVKLFEGRGAFQPNAAIKLIWDFGGAGEIVVWTEKGDGKMPFNYEIPSPDGVKKLAVCLDNGEAGDLFLSGYAEIEVNT